MTRTQDIYAFGATGTQLTATVQENGEISMMIIEIPNFTNAVTTTITVKDIDNYTLWTSDALNENSTYRRSPLAIPLDYNYTIYVDISGAAGGSGGNITVTSFVNTQDRR